MKCVRCGKPFPTAPLSQEASRLLGLCACQSGPTVATAPTGTQGGDAWNRIADHIRAEPARLAAEWARNAGARMRSGRQSPNDWWRSQQRQPPLVECPSCLELNGYGLMGARCHCGTRLSYPKAIEARCA